jgi:hypothetical protein
MKKIKYFMTILTICLLANFSYAIDTLNGELPKEKVSVNPVTGQILEKDPYKASENTGRTSSPVSGNVTERENTKTPTNQSYTTGNITENVGEDGKKFSSEIAPKRQFLTFRTNSGKEFHLIIDYMKNTQQVRMLTEVNESDLLNIIDKRNRTESGAVESQEEMEARIREQVKAEIAKENAEKQAVEEEKIENTDIKDKKTQEKKNDDTMLYVFGGVIAISIILAKKFIKNKHKNNKPLDDDEDISNNSVYDDGDEEDINFEDDM